MSRPIEAGNSASCAGCGTPVKFTAKVRHWQVIANVYVGGKWNRVEHYHADCYENAGEPYGTADPPSLGGREPARAAKGGERGIASRVQQREAS